MLNQRWDLISESDPRKLGDIISYIFTNDYLYIHRSFRKKLISDRKGFVHINILRQEQPLTYFFKVNQINQSDINKIIRYAVQQFCKQLIFKNDRIRRVKLFDCSVYHKIKPFSLQRPESLMNVSDLRDYLGESAFSPSQLFDPNSDNDSFLVYAPYYRQMLEDKNELPFKVVSYQRLCEERERESRYWQQQQRRYYSPIGLIQKSEKRNRQQYLRTQERGRAREHLRQKMNSLQAQFSQNGQLSPLPLTLIRKALFSNSEFNLLLGNYINKIGNRLDQQ